MATADPAAILSCRGLHRTLGEGNNAVDVIRGLDLDIGAGQFVSIVGHSGSGKSTLLYLLGALDRPTSGKIWLAGEELGTLSDHQIAERRNRKLGFVFQFHHLLPEFSAAENVMLPMLKRGKLSHGEAYRKAEEILGWFDLARKKDRNSRKLSGGEQQRVAIARALANDPAVVLADEPTGNLDSANTEIVFACFRKVATELGRTVVMVTHEPDLAGRTDRIVTLVDGKIAGDIEVVGNRSAGSNGRSDRSDDRADGGNAPPKDGG